MEKVDRVVSQGRTERAGRLQQPKDSIQDPAMSTDWVLDWDREHRQRTRVLRDLLERACLARNRWMLVGSLGWKLARSKCGPSARQRRDQDESEYIVRADKRTFAGRSGCSL